SAVPRSRDPLSLRDALPISLASLELREEVRRSLKALRAAATVVFGDPDHVDVTGADAERGAFLSPILLSGDPERSEPHEVEAFGPVATLLPYTSTEQVVDFEIGRASCRERGKSSAVAAYGRTE